jgi:excisionase family DNA binding protein
MLRKPRQTGTTDANSVPAVPASQCEVLTVAETAALLKVPPSSIYEWTRFRGSNRGTPLPHRKVGKYLRFVKSELMEWLLALPQSTNTRKRKYTRKNRVAV